jgi:hypothetical protein
MIWKVCVSRQVGVHWEGDLAYFHVERRETLLHGYDSSKMQ